jgi:hypothetical protein
MGGVHQFDHVSLVMKNYVIPAQAGIHHLKLSLKQARLILTGQAMDSRLRGNDGPYICRQVFFLQNKGFR